MLPPPIPMPQYPEEPFPLDSYPSNEAGTIFNADWSLTQYGAHTIALALYNEIQDAHAQSAKTGYVRNVYHPFARKKLRVENHADRQELIPWLEAIVECHAQFYARK